MRKIRNIGGTLLFLFITFVVLCNIWVVYSTKSRVYYSIDRLPANNVALVLGTSKYTIKGTTNLFFHFRIEAAAKMYTQKKAKHFIASGDNALTYYNEPLDMKNALMKQGIPSEKITLDYAGFRTFDSVVRSKKVFGQDSITIVTQDFHCYRALFISDFYGMDAIAFAASGIPKGYSYWILFREYFARCKAVIDIFVLRKEPRFLGETIKIERTE